MWSSLKYEVRNGEIPEAIQETLSIFESLPCQLAKSSNAEANLTEFLSQTWKDTAEDLENPTYTEQAGSILISIAGGSVLAFCRTSSRLLEAVRRNIGQPKSPTHTKNLLVLLNNLVRTQRSLTTKMNEWTEDDRRAFQTDGFEIPVAVIDDVYFKLFRENTVDSPSKDQVEIAKEAINGLALVVDVQRVRADWTTTAAYEQDTLKEICTALSYRATNSFNVPTTATAELRDIDVAAVVALKTAVKAFPEGYAKILSSLVSEVEKRDWKGVPAERTFDDLHGVCQRVAFIGCADIPEKTTPIVNFALFSGTMLNILSVLFNSGANIKFCAVVADSLATGIAYFIKATEDKGLKQTDIAADSWKLDGLEHMVDAEIPDFPKLRYKKFNLYDPMESTKSMKTAQHSVFTSFLLVGVHVVSQLYQHATAVEMSADGEIPLLLLSEALLSADNINEGSRHTSDNLAAYVGELARAASLVLRELSATAQISLDLDNRIAGCFNNGLQWISTDKPLVLHGNAETYALSCGIAQAMHGSTVMKMVSDK